jgi:CO/xanthine dehydrogenase FAD-binding subunit
MKIEFIQPHSLPEALENLKSPNSRPLAGGTFLNTPESKLKLERQAGDATIVLVDLQNLGLTHIRKHGNTLEIEANVTLQQLCENAYTPEDLKNAIKLEAPLNIRNMATVAGTLVSCSGRSAFTCAMLALDAKLIHEPGTVETFLGSYLPIREESAPGKLITKIAIPLNASLAFEHVGRTKFDLPIVCAAVAKWTSGRTRLALGGFGSAPFLAMDGTVDDDIESAARNGYHEAADEWASAEYRADVAATLAGRCINRL